MVHYTKVMSGIARYIDSEILPRFTGSWKAWAIGTASGVALQRSAEVMDMLCSLRIVSGMNLVDGEMIDIDCLMSELQKQAVKPITVDVPSVGTFTFNASDVSKLYQYIREA